VSVEMTKAQGCRPEPLERHAQPEGSAILKKCQGNSDTASQKKQGENPEKKRAVREFTSDQRLCEWKIGSETYILPAADEAAPYESVSREVLDLALEHNAEAYLWLWIALSSYVRAPQNELTAEPVNVSDLAEALGRSASKVRNGLKHLEAAGLIVKVSTRKQVALGNTKQGGNAYLLTYRKPRKREGVPISVTTATAVKVEGAQRIAPSASQRETESAEKVEAPPTSSPNTEAAKMTVAYSTSEANTAQNDAQVVKSDSLKVRGNNYVELKRTTAERSRASAEQVSYLSRLLDNFSPIASAVVCDLKGLSSISDLNKPEARALISALNGEQPETLNALREEIKRREERAMRDREAKSAAYRSQIEAERAPMPESLKAILRAVKQGATLEAAVKASQSETMA
jgi:predicted transcriptional regulator